MESRYEEVRELVWNLIAEAVPKAQAKEAEERAGGMVLYDSPVARLICPPIEEPATLALTEIPEGTRWMEWDDLIWSHGGKTKFVNIYTTGTTFLTARRMWPAYPRAVALIREHGLTDESVLYTLFHYIAGIAAVVESDAKILVGIRSAAVATSAGMVSFPAGLAEPGERMYMAGKRELLEETGLNCCREHHNRRVMVRRPDAPSITFLYPVVTEQEDEVQETYEAKGRKYIWVPREDCLFPALRDGDTQPLVAEFRRQGIDVPDTLQFAPDILAGCRLIYGF